MDIKVKFTLRSLMQICILVSSLLMVDGQSKNVEVYSVQNFTADSPEETFYHMAVRNNGDVYTSTQKSIYRLMDSLAFIRKNDTCSSKDCININKVLVIDYDNNRLVTCGGGNEGQCESRSLDELTYNTEKNAEKVVSINDLSAVGYIGSKANKNYLYVAATDDGKMGDSFYTISIRSLINFNVLDSNTFRINDEFKNRIQYVSGFSYQNFKYFVANILESDSITLEAFPRLSRICDSLSNFDHLSDVYLQCVDGTTSYKTIKAVSLGLAGPDLASSLGISSTDYVLYAVFFNSSSKNSALCIYKWSDIVTAFEDALFGCATKDSDQYKLSYAIQPTCNSINIPRNDISNFFCQENSNWIYSQGTKEEAASSRAVLVLPSHNLTAVTTAIERNHTVAFLGTADGHLLKAHLVSNISARIFEDITLVEGSMVRSDMFVSVDNKILLALTEKKLFKLHVENCAQYTACNECIGPEAGKDGDPYCGWCTLERKCNRQSECASTWLPYNNAACASILSVEPPSLLYMQGKQTLTLSIQELPPVTGNSYYECDFNGTYKSRLQIGANNTCTSPPVENIPDIPAGEDHVDIELAIFSSETGIKFLTTNFPYYNCDAMKSCSECVNSPWAACMWCIGDNVCKSGQCMQNDVLVEHQNQTYCPQIITDTELVPVNFPKEIIIKTRNLPKGKAYECNIEIEGEMMQIPAVLKEDYVYCNSKMYEYNGNVEELTVAITISWDDSIIDNEYTLVLYKCAVNRPDCSRCLSVNVTEVELECVWCEDSRCTYNGSCNALSDVCGAPEVTEVTPPTLATSTSTRQVITVTGKDLGRDANNILNITVNNQICDIVEGSFNVSDQSVMCEAPACNALDSCGEAPVMVYSNAGVSNTFRKFTYQDPIITDFTPKEGIMSGGTRISIIGEFLMTGSSQQVKIGDANCEDISVTNTNINCTTTSSHVRGEMSLTVYFGNVNRTSQMFRVTSDPNVTRITQSTCICSGGRQLEIFGTNFDAVQVVNISVSFGGSTSPKNNCTLSRNDIVICNTPKFPGDVCPTTCDDGQPVDMQIFFDGYTYSHNHGGNTFKYTTNPNYYMFNNTNNYNLKDGSLELTNRELNLKGKDLNCASEKNEVKVFVGEKICDISTLSRTVLICTTSQDSFSNDLVRVEHGNFLVELGKVNSATSTIWIGIVAGVGSVAVIILLVVVCLKQKEHKAKRSSEHLLMELDCMVDSVKEQALVAIADMTLNLNDLTQDLEGHGMPFRGPKEYTMMMMFSGYDKRPIEANGIEREQENLTEFSRLLSNKDFLVVFINVINSSGIFSIREKGNFASLLAIAMVVDDRLNYLTSVLEVLLRNHIEDMVSDRKAKQVLRRNEGVTEKLLSNWVCLCMYSHLQEHDAQPLYLMYQSIRCYVNKGAVDAITHHSQHALSLNTLLREDVKYEEITLDVIFNSDTVRVEVLSCDSVTQVKEKILNVLCKNKPYSKRYPAKDIDLDWQHGRAGHLILRDLDSSSIQKGNKTKLNTMEHYKIKTGYKVKLVPKQDEANASINQSNDTLFGLENLAYSGTLDPESVIYSDEIDLELGTVFHLVDESEDGVAGSRSSQKTTKKKTIDELFFPKMLATKQTILKYVQDMFHSILKPAAHDHSPPLAIQYLFDLFDREQRKHKVGHDVLKAWKNQSLCERFWVTVINHPEFLFDIPKTSQVKDTLSVISNAFTDSCVTNELKYSQHSDTHRLLYAKEIPTYRNLVDSFYESIKNMPELDHMAMEKQLKDTSKSFQGIFSRNSMLELLYSYAVECNAALLKALENDDSCSRSRMGFRLEQIPQMRSNVYEVS